MESIKDYRVRRIKEAGSKRWPAIAAEISETNKPIGESLLRKLAYGDRDNPGGVTVQPPIDYSLAVDPGDRQLPDVTTSRAAE